MSKKKKRIIKWTVYWLLVLGFYISISLMFGNFIMYTPVLAFAAANFVIRLAADLSFGKIRYEALSKVLCHGVNVLSLVILIAVGASIIENGSNYNVIYIESLDYSMFHSHSTSSYGPESGVYTVRTENEEIRSPFYPCTSRFKSLPMRKPPLDAGYEDAVYLFGENDETVSYPDHNSGFFDVILEKESTEAVFAGHDHINNMGIRYKGVDLVYSKSIDYIAYPGIAHRTEQRGGILITLSGDGGY